MSESQKPQLTAVGHLPDDVVIEHLKRLQKISADHCEDHFKTFIRTLDEKLLEFADNAKTNQEVTRLQEMVREFRMKGKDVKRHFITHLAEGFVKFKNKKLDTSTGEDKYRGDMLALVDNADLEETIAVSSVVRRADELYNESLWLLEKRFAVLNDGEPVADNNNPASPVQYCEALRRALRVLTFDAKAKIIAYKVFDKEFIQTLREVYDDLNTYLAKHDVLPNLRFNAAQAAGGSQSNAQQADDFALPGFDTPLESEQQPGQAAPVAQAPSPFGNVMPGNAAPPLPQSTIVQTPDPSAPSVEYQGKLFDAIRTLQAHIAGGVGAMPPAASQPAPTAQPQVQQVPTQTVASPGSAAAPGGPAGQSVVYSNQQVVSALQVLQSQALNQTGGLVDTPTGEIEAVTPQSMQQVGMQLAEQLKEEEEDGELNQVDMHTIELVGMLFEYMLSDDHLPDSIKAILSYLHTPFLKVAFLDTSFFEKTDHPARLLLNALADAGTKWVSNDGTSQYEIYTKIKQIVSKVLEDFEKDVRLFAELLLEFSSYVKKISRRQDLMEKRAMEKAQGEEKLREVKIRVNQEVRNRTDGKELPSAVLLLLLQPWSDYLAFLLLRYGDESESWKTAIKTVDDLLWSITPKTEAKDKSRQSELCDDILDTVETGFETIGYDQAKGKKLIEAIVSLQKMAMQSQKVEAAPEPMREQLETMAAEKAGDSAPKEEPASPEEEKMVDNLKMIEFGTWFEFDGGKRLKVAWYNSKTMHYMLVDQMGKKVAMKSGLELARSMLKGQAKVIAGSTKPFFERALENIFQNLNAKAEAIKTE